MMWFVAMARAACTFSASVTQLDANLAAAESAYASLDVEEFQRAMNEVDYLVPCLTEPVTVAQAAQLHRIRGIGSYVDDRPAAVEASMRAARRLEPDHRFDDQLMPEGFDLRVAYEAMPATPGEHRPIPKPRDGAILVDGRSLRERPLDAAALMQVVVDGVATDTRYLLPGDPLPTYPGVQRRRSVLLGTAALTATASAVLYGSAWATRAQLPQSNSLDELKAGTQLTHGLLAGSTALFIASAVQAGFAVRGEP